MASSGSNLRGMMSGLKKRGSRLNDNMTMKWDQDPANQEYIEHRELPLCRRMRHVSESVLITNMPNLAEVPAHSKRRLYIRKVRFCSYMFEFAAEDEESKDTKEERKLKSIKRQSLLELVSYITEKKPSISFTDEELVETFDMLSINLFRKMPATVTDMFGVYDPEEDEPVVEPSWPHLHVVYEFLLRLVQLPPPARRSLEKFFNRTFMLNLFELFSSEDRREREYLKTVIHRIYGNFMHLRPFIRRSMNNIIYGFLYNNKYHNGIAELLEIFGSIINGFAVPLKQQHKVFLQHVLLPLHTAPALSLFHPQLVYCVTQFLEKDQLLCVHIIKALIKYWPKTNTKKILLFISELETVLDYVDSEHLGDYQLEVFHHIAKLISNPHFQVAERAICLLNNEVVIRFLAKERQVYLPELYRPLYTNLWDRTQSGFISSNWEELGHWSPSVLELSRDLKNLFVEMDSSLMLKAHAQITQIQSAETKKRAFLDSKWEELEAKYSVKEEGDEVKSQ